MVDTGIFATTAEVQRKVGANASATSNVEAYINDFMAQAESFINVIVGFNFSDVYSNLNADVKAILKEISSNLAAIYVLNYDATAVITATSNITFENRIMVLNYRLNQGIRVLRETGTETFIRNA